jgi:hypothetical protein
VGARTDGHETLTVGLVDDVSRVLGILLGLGLAVTTARCEAGWTVRVTGGRREASGVAESACEALTRAGWRWVLN